MNCASFCIHSRKYGEKDSCNLSFGSHRCSSSCRSYGYVQERYELWCLDSFLEVVLLLIAYFFVVYCPLAIAHCSSLITHCCQLLTVKGAQLKKLQPHEPQATSLPLPDNLGRALEGLRVLELASVMAAPSATRILANLGAQVPK